MNHKDIRICFVGDSFINGTGDESTLGWTGRLCAEAKLKNSSITQYNLGIRRNTSHDILLRIENEVSLRLPDDLSVSYDPRVVISFGVNDTVIENGKRRVAEKDSIDNLINIIEFLKEKYKVIIVGPPAINDDEQNARIKLLCDQFEFQAEQLGVAYIDLFYSLVDDEEYKKEIINNDGAHPKGNGYGKLAKIIGSSENWWFYNHSNE